MESVTESFRTERSLGPNGLTEIEKPVLKAMGPSIVKVILKAHKLEVSHFEIFKLQSSVVIRTV